MQLYKHLPVFLLVVFVFFSCSSPGSRQTEQPITGTPPNADPVMGNSAPVMQRDSTPAVSWLRVADNNWYLQAPNNSFYLYINLRGNRRAAVEKRVPLNISLVLDRSGSMHGDKINYAKKAAGFVIDQLNSDDIVSLVNYDDEVEITSPSQPVKNKELLKTKIDALYDRGSTNLTGGMLEGYAQAESTKKQGYVNRVLLLTDGLANAGVTEPAQIRAMVEKKYTSKGIALSTFGLGADYNENLLTQLAETGRANYYFIDSPDKIPAIFAKELKGLLSVVAQNSLVQVDFPANLRVAKVYGYPAEIEGSSLSIRLNDIYAGDERGVLIKLTTTAPARADIAFNCTLRYTDAGSFETITDSRKIVVKQTTDVSVMDKGKNRLTEEMIALYESTEAFDEILADVDAGDYDKAKIKADSVIAVLKVKQQYLRSDKLKKQEESLHGYSSDMERVKSMRETEKKIYQKSNKSANYSIRKGKE